MRRTILFLLLVSACTKTPEEAATLYDVQISNGFQTAGGVAITDQHILTSLKLFERNKAGQVLDGKGEKYGVAVLNRESNLNLALLYAEDSVIPYAKVGCSSTLIEGAPLITQIFNDTSPKLMTGLFKGWRYSGGRAYLETEIDTPQEAVGVGFFGPEGTLVGVQAFKKGKKLTYILPIEYVTVGERPMTSGLIEREPCEVFTKKREEALEHPDELPEPIQFDNLVIAQYFSTTALVGVLSMLEKKDGAAHNAPITYSLEVLTSDERREVSKGSLEKNNLKWSSAPDALAKMKEQMQQAYGESWVKQNMDPYDFGEIVYRLPYKAFCSAVKEEGDHILTLHLADGRDTGDIGLSGLPLACMGQADTELGTVVEEQVGFVVKESAPGAAPAEPEPKKGKRKKRKRRKRRR